MIDSADWLGGRDGDNALDLDGQRLTYQDLRHRVAELAGALPPGPIAVWDEKSDSVTTLVRFYAAVTTGRIAMVVPPELDVSAGFPAGTGLVVSTSGSAGHARAVARTTASWTDSFAAVTDLTGFGPSDVVALTGPLISTLHLFAAVHTLSVGAELTDNLWRATAVHCVPTTLQSLLRDRPPNLLTVVVAGGVLPESVAVSAVSAGLHVIEYYGATELSFVAARRVPQPLRAFPGVELRVADGCIVVRSPFLALGFPSNDQAPLAPANEGFVGVGDIGELVGDVLMVRGRGSSAINSGGMTVIAEDVETVLSTAPGVSAVAVVGQQHPRFGEVVVAVLEVVNPHSGRAIREHARRRLGPAALPRTWLLVDDLPRTPAGKPARDLISAAIAAGTLATRKLP